MDSDTSSGILRNNLENTLQDAEEIVTKTKRAAGKEYRIQYVYENLNRSQEALDRINCDSSCKDKPSNCGARTHDPGIKSPVLYRLS